MSVKVHLYLRLPRLTSTSSPVDVIEVKGRTVGECLVALVERFPAVKGELFDSSGRLLDQIDIWVNNLPAYEEGLDRPVNDGDTIYLFAAKLVEGGG